MAVHSFWKYLADLARFGLTVTPDPDAKEPPGHSLIPQLTAATLNKKPDKKKWQEWRDVQAELAKLASQQIVHRPMRPPLLIRWSRLLKGPDEDE